MAALAAVMAVVSAGCGAGPGEAAAADPFAGASDRAFAEQVGEGLDRASAANAACGDLERWTEAMADAVDLIEGALAAPPADPDGWFGSEPASAAADGARARLVLLEGCAAGATEAPAAVVDEALAVAGRASAANDRLRRLLRGGGVGATTEFWFHPDQISHTLEAQRLLGEDPVEVLLLGSSTTKRGFDPLRLTESMGRSTLNAGSARLFPPAVASWWTTLTEVGLDPGTVVVGVSTWQDFFDCTPDRQRQMEASLEMAEQAFSAIPALAAHPAPYRLVGGPMATYDTTSLPPETPPPGGRGLLPAPDETDEDALAGYLEIYTPIMAQAAYCPQNAAATEALVAELVASDAEVVVVALPLSETMTNLHPGGRAAHLEALGAYRSATLAAGGQWLDLTDLLDEHEFLDLTHANHRGRDRITDELITYLAG